MTNTKTIDIGPGRVDADQRLVSGFISTTDVDMYGDVVLPEGMDDSYYKTVKSLTLHHDSRYPVGVCRKYETKKNGVYAQFYMSTTALGEDALTLVKEGVIGSFSIEFDPGQLTSSPPDPAERRKYGPRCKRVFRSWLLTGVSLVPQPANPTANVTSVKSLHAERVGELLREGLIRKSSLEALGLVEEVEAPPAGVSRTRIVMDEDGSMMVLR